MISFSHRQPQDFAGNGLDFVQVASGLGPYVGHCLVASDAHADLVSRYSEFLSSEGVSTGGEKRERSCGEHADDEWRVAAWLCGQGEETDLRLGCADALDGVDAFEFIAGIGVGYCCWRCRAARDAF